MADNYFKNLENMQKDINLTEYENLIANLDENSLIKEQEKLRKRLKLSYTVVGDGFYNTEVINIADLPKEKNRVWLRKKISFAQALIGGLLKRNGVQNGEYSTFMGYIKDKFMQTVFVPSYATANLQGKTIPFADKLTVNGMLAYRKYLLLLYYNIHKQKKDFEIAIAEALIEEQKQDKDLNREKFFKRFFLPKSVSAVYETMLKEKLVSAKLKKDFGYQKLETSNKE